MTPHNFSKIKIKPLTGKELADEIDSIASIEGIDLSLADMNKTKEILSKTSLSSDLILERRGGDMWDDLRQWLSTKDFVDIHVVKEKMKEIEKEYGVG
jgi:hypothetical protein